MSKTPKKRSKKPPTRSLVPTSAPSTLSSTDFDEVVRLIESARGRAVAAVNSTLIELYWQIGEFITRKVASEGWGKATVQTLADHLRRRQAGARGTADAHFRQPGVARQALID